MNSATLQKEVGFFPAHFPLFLNLGFFLFEFQDTVWAVVYRTGAVK
jgi:hypothetical protein